MLTKFNREMDAYFQELYALERKVLVFGEGAAGARIALVGEAPGERETVLGRPFVGKAGKNLDQFLTATGVDRAGLYVTNTVKFRPTRLSAAGRQVNRPPTREEVELFLPWLRREIELVNPRCVVTLGNTALRALTGGNTAIGAAHGVFQKTKGRLLFPMYHPASLIYNPRLAPEYERDLALLAEWIAHDSEKFL